MPTSLREKLQIKAGLSMAVHNAPQGFVDYLKTILIEVALSEETTRPTDAVLLFVATLAETLPRTQKAIQSVRPGGLLWVAYPKGTSRVKTDVNRDRLWHTLRPTGWRPVRMISLDETWAVMRLRPERDVRK